MDKEEARFVLRCFRPDGADASDPDFKEALQLAAEDRELGEWLAHERAQDAAFSAALGRLELPEGLREEILTGLAAERGDVPQADEADAAVIAALVGIRPPEGLRTEILSAMSRSAGNDPVEERVERRGGGWWKFGLPLAAAAGVALAFVMNQPGGVERPVQIHAGAVPVALVESTSIRTLESPSFSLDLQNPDHQTLFKHIRKSGRACPEGAMPRGLKEIPGIGCLELEIDGKKGALVCFRRGENDTVHLVVFRRDDVKGGLPDAENPALEQKGNWSVARWEDGGRVFFMLSKTTAEHLGEIF